MTVSDYRKEFKQLNAKPIKLQRYMKHNKPKDRKYGIAVRKCSRCLKTGSHIRKYGLSLCRYCFRDIATKIGFKKYN
jgi:small subunit ribosomal protein S14